MRLSLNLVSEAGGSRLTIRSTAPLQAEVRQEPARIVLGFGNQPVELVRDSLSQKDTFFHSIELEHSAVSTQLVIVLTDRTLRARVTHLPSQNAYVVEVNRPEGASEASKIEGTPAAPVPVDTRKWRYITVDAGHGGSDRGALIKENLFEKDITLAVAKRVRWALETRLGVQVVLSRSEDEVLSLESRAIAANQARSNLFISVHVGNGPSPEQNRSYAYVARIPESGEPSTAESNPPTRLFVPWEHAQLSHLGWSERLAECLQGEMNRALNGGETSLGHRAAPLKLLASLAMPAVLVEVGNARDSGFQNQAASPEFQNLVAATLATAVEKFRAVHERR